MLSVPPPIIETAKLIKYSDTSPPVAFTGVQKIFVDGNLMGAVPGIAIGQQISDDTFHLYLCNEVWEVLAVVEGRSVSDLTSKAERWYHGLNERWHDTPYSAEDCDKFLNNDRGDMRCSFLPPLGLGVRCPIF